MQPFAEDIAAFKPERQYQLSGNKGILFVGSSSFTKWTDVQQYFPLPDHQPRLWRVNPAGCNTV